jgi:hypothetical protein
MQWKQPVRQVWQQQQQQQKQQQKQLFCSVAIAGLLCSELRSQPNQAQAAHYETTGSLFVSSQQHIVRASQQHRMLVIMGSQFGAQVPTAGGKVGSFISNFAHILSARLMSGWQHSVRCSCAAELLLMHHAACRQRYAMMACRACLISAAAATDGGSGQLGSQGFCAVPCTGRVSSIMQTATACRGSDFTFVVSYKGVRLHSGLRRCTPPSLEDFSRVCCCHLEPNSTGMARLLQLIDAWLAAFLSWH